jgi:hypothetical protein
MLEPRFPRAAGTADVAAETGLSGARSAAELFFNRPRAVVVYKPSPGVAHGPELAAESTGSAAFDDGGGGWATNPPSPLDDRGPRVFRIDARDATRVGEAQTDDSHTVPFPSEPPRRRRRLPEARRPGQVHHVVVAVPGVQPSHAPVSTGLQTGAPVEHHAVEDRGASYAGVCRALGEVQRTLQAARQARQWQAQLRRLVQPAR